MNLMNADFYHRFFKTGSRLLRQIRTDSLRLEANDFACVTASANIFFTQPFFKKGRVACLPDGQSGINLGIRVRRNKLRWCRFFIFSLTFSFFCFTIYGVGSIRDPFEPLLPKEKKQEEKVEYGESKEIEILPPNIVIEGVLWGTSKPMAIVDGSVYKIGERIKDTEDKILKIEKSSVFVLHGGKVYKMKIVKEKEGE